MQHQDSRRPVSAADTNLSPHPERQLKLAVVNKGWQCEYQHFNININQYLQCNVKSLAEICLYYRFFITKEKIKPIRF